MQETKKGLEGIVALDTSISFIDGMQGILKYRGLAIEQLAEMSYDSVSYLLVNGMLPNDQELAAYSFRLKTERRINGEMIDIMRVCNYGTEALDSLRTAISCTAQMDHENDNNSLEANKNKAIRLIAKLPTMLAALYRCKKGETPYLPDDNLSHGANFLYMLRGEAPSAIEAEAMEKDFIISAEHELNPSTFALRITASTLADVYSAIITGLCTLKGPLHGGARKGVMEMLDEVGNPENANAYVLHKLASKQKIMGFGHRVYRTGDPRSRIFKEMARRLADEKGDPTWYEIAESLEHAMYREFLEMRGRPMYPNVDFYSGVIYKYLDIPLELATSVFAIGRVSGWTAHCFEQYMDNRVIRPRAHYV
ncbi:citrate/2-methylcitrate synthase [Methanolobus zinderi]|uniref:Citrate synthase n=1 Tax=Methanolobus zinderi TaxID=536044 RepID=A0A7D5I4J6_9EURY|nr:citrate/2-methylcitrate synthase [Methanolobus zinderi]QLC49784.1 citrate/2-methylcitrate synthase [Methanolobus zinderi]